MVQEIDKEFSVVLGLDSMDLAASRFNKLADICADIGQVSLASVVLPFLFDRFDLRVVILGLAVSFMFWLTSVLLARRES